ncbi:MAG TPA: hypothetical protein VHW23_37560 [Kofleriaceae bacterium]|nr:hypothetical protein [Kofleriaceae bacterium]
MSQPSLSEPMTWQEICATYPDEWVALVEIDWVNDRDFDFRSARVAGHGKRRRQPMIQAEPLWARYDEIGHYFTGRTRTPLSPSIFV